jgi:hypothetical protein
MLLRRGSTAKAGANDQCAMTNDQRVTQHRERSMAKAFVLENNTRANTTYDPLIGYSLVIGELVIGHSP